MVDFAGNPYLRDPRYALSPGMGKAPDGYELLDPKARQTLDYIKKNPIGAPQKKPEPATTTASPANPPAKPQAATLPEPKTKAEFDALPKGARFKAPDGSERVKP